MDDTLKTTFIWTVKERDPETGLFVPKLTRKNIQTNYGLTAYASAFAGSYTPPVYLVIDAYGPSLLSLSGTTLVLSSATQPTIGSDTQLVLSIGTGQQEVVSFSGTPSQNGNQWTYNLTAIPSLSHVAGDICVRNPTVTTRCPSSSRSSSTTAPTRRTRGCSRLEATREALATS